MVKFFFSIALLLLSTFGIVDSVKNDAQKIGVKKNEISLNKPRFEAIPISENNEISELNHLLNNKNSNKINSGDFKSYIFNSINETLTVQYTLIKSHSIPRHIEINFLCRFNI